MCVVSARDSKSLDCYKSQIEDQIRDNSQFSLIRGLFVFFTGLFLISTALSRAAFCRVLASVCEAKRSLRSEVSLLC